MKRKLAWLTAGLVLTAVIGLAALAAMLGDLPSPEELEGRLHVPSLSITDRDGRLLYEILPENGGRQQSVPLDMIPIYLQQATIATEDRRFYQNPGVDLLGVARALWINLRGGETLAGGSTITQQVARNLLLGEDERFERSLRRKLRESYLAWRLARRFTKDEILAVYLNQTYYGGLAYGVQAAAQTYFGKAVSELDLAESALIAGLPQAPSLYNPFTNLEAAFERQKVVLSLMESAGYITPEQRSLAERERLVFAREPYPVEAPHFVMMVRAELDQLFTPEELYQSGGVIVRTSLNLDWQKIAERAIARHLESLQRSEDGLGHNVHNAALVALDVHTGEILAMVGSPDYFDAANGGAINMALAPRQPGSALKPLVYAAALDPTRPHPWTAATMILDVRTSFATSEGGSYVPTNYDLREHGPVLVRQALGSSLNIPAVAALNEVGLPDLFSLASSLGITTLRNPADHDLTLALGGGEVRLLELTASYGAFASQGYRLDPVSILDVRGVQGNVLYTATPPPKRRVLDERVAWLISDILSDNDARTLGFGANSVLRLGFPAAVKTGTTTNFHDNWTVGYTPDIVAGVWVGNSDYQPMRDVNGLTGAAPIWHQFMRAVLAGVPEKPFSRPKDLARAEVCAVSGLLPTPACPFRRWEWFIPGTQPTDEDNVYRNAWLDPQTGSLVAVGSDNIPPAAGLRPLKVLDLPPQAAGWARSQGLVLLSDLLSAGVGGPGGAVSLVDQGLILISPAPNALYRLAPGFAASAQRLPVEVSAPPGGWRISLWVDGERLAVFDTTRQAGPYRAWWTLAPGAHQAWAEGVDAAGRSLSSQRVDFQVLLYQSGETPTP